MANGERRARLTKSALRALKTAREAARRASRSDFTPPADLARGASSTPSIPPSMPPVERFTPTPLPSESAPQPSAAPSARRARSSATPPGSTPPSSTPAGTTPPRPRRGERRGERSAERRGFGAANPTAATPSAPLTSEEAELVELIDRLAVVADGSGLAEIEIAAAGTRVVVRSRAALAASNVVAVSGAAAPAASSATSTPALVPPEGSAAPKAAAAAPSPSSASAAFVAAPLTGVFYSARTPGDDPLIAVGSIVAVGQPIGLIEAMKLFNEIKSDRAGRVVRVFAENGRLVKAKAPIIEVEPA
ncbi:MAG: biotin/lipoyl-containing protein [Candidatus Limnocylindrus sp.]